MVSVAALRKWNWGFAALHATLFVCVLVLFYGVRKNKEKDKVEAWRFAPVASDDPSVAWRYSMQAKSLGDIALAPLLLAFIAITVGAHVFYAASASYPAWLARGWNPARWVEYAASAGVMILIIGLLDGSRSPDVLLLLGAATAVTMAFGFLGERRGVLGWRDGATETAEWVASLGLFAATWAAVGYNFFSQVSDGNSDRNDGANKPPSWLWAIFFTQLFFFSSFAVVRAWHAAQADAAATMPTAELSYTALSAGAKATLVGLVLGGLTA